MTKEARRSKVTPETQAEAERLAKLWASRPNTDEEPRLSQAEFGEAFGIGNQSAVGQFLRGEVVLSLKAARGFATGLKCRIADFSPRLAAEAAAIANMVPNGPLSPELQEIATAFSQMGPNQIAWAMKTIRMTLEVAPSVPAQAVTDEQNREEVHDRVSSNRRAA